MESWDSARERNARLKVPLRHPSLASPELRSQPRLPKASLVATRIRQLGVDRILYGSDGAGGGNLAPREAWAAFRQLPLSDAEFRAIENNIALLCGDWRVNYQKGGAGRRLTCAQPTSRAQRTGKTKRRRRAARDGAVNGHEFGLKEEPKEDKKALIAFLKTLSMEAQIH